MDPAECAWSLDEADGPPGARRRLLLVSLAKPPLTETEVTWKKGARSTVSAAVCIHKTCYRNQSLLSTI